MTKSIRRRKHTHRGGDCGCSTSRVALQAGGRVINSSEYYGINSGHYSAENTAAPFLTAQLAERAAAMSSVAGSPLMAGGKRRSRRASGWGKKKKSQKK